MSDKDLEDVTANVIKLLVNNGFTVKRELKMKGFEIDVFAENPEPKKSYDTF